MNKLIFALYKFLVFSKRSKFFYTKTERGKDMKIVLFNLIFFMRISGVWQRPNENGVNDNIHERSSINLNLDKENSDKIESILLQVWRKKKKERPWIVTEDNGIFKIKGTFHYPKATKAVLLKLYTQIRREGGYHWWVEVNQDLNNLRS